MDKYDYIKTIIKECLNEGIDEYKVFDGSFSDFQKAYPTHYITDRGKSQTGGRVYVYSVVPASAVKSIFENGQDRQFSGSGEGTQTYGKGFYGTMSYEDAFKIKDNGAYNGHSTPAIIKYVLKDGLKNFLVLSDDLRSRNGVKETPSQQLLKYFPKELVDRYERECITNSRFLTPQERAMGLSFIDQPTSVLRKAGQSGRGWNNARSLSDFFVGFDPNNMSSKSNRKNGLVQDVDLKNAGVRGYVNNGMTDGDLIVVKNYKDLMPVAYVVDPKTPNESTEDWKTDFSTEENFNRINSMEDAEWRFGHVYPETDLKEPAINGLMRVKRDGKYNFVDLDNDNLLVPDWLDDAQMMDDASNESIITIGGKKALLKHNKSNGKTVFRLLGPTGKPVGLPMDYANLIKKLGKQ